MPAMTHLTPTQSQRGFSLIELMVASLIGLILLAAVVRVVMNTSSSHRDIARAGQLLENGRYAMHLLSEEIAHAGFLDQFDALEAPTSEPVICASTLAELEAGIGMPVQGLDAQAGFTLPSCIPAGAYLAGTDILVIRRASTTPATSLDANLVYIQGRYDELIMEQGDPANFTLENPMSGDAIPVRRYRNDIYFISPCSDFSGGSCKDQIPTLKRVELGPGLTYSDPPVSLVEGVENLQLYFGVDSEPADKPDGAPDRSASGEIYRASAGAPSTQAGRDAWANVMGVQVFLLTRDLEPSLGYSDDKTYVLGPAEHTTPHSVGGGGAFKRQVFSSFIRVINPSSRRES